jgi:hypothetical protein
VSGIRDRMLLLDVNLRAERKHLNAIIDLCNYPIIKLCMMK